MQHEYFNSVFGELRENSAEYDEALRSMAELSHSLTPLLNDEGEVTLTLEQHEIFKKYIDARAQIDLHEWKALYLQGHRDCIELLRVIRAI